MRFLRPLALVLPCLLAACSAPVTVSPVRPEAPAGLASSGSPAELLAGIRSVQASAAGGDAEAVKRYNHLVARLVEALDAGGLDPWSSPVRIGDPRDGFVLSGRAPGGVPTGPGHLTPVDALRIRSEYGELNTRSEVIGAPLVAARGYDAIGHSEFRKNVPVRNVTAVVGIRGGRAVIELLDPLQAETAVLGGRRCKLAADHGAAILVALSKSRIDKLGFVRLLNPAKYDNTANLNFTQPYDPKRIPVLLVHGLDSTPATFAPLYFNLLQDPVIRRNYQFWLFSYPSGYPFHYSAALLRRELDEVARDFPGHRDIVIVGHSMGGVISRLMVTDAGDRLWRKAFGRSPEETRVAGSSRGLLEETLVFDSRKRVSRAVFFSAPHRGSDMAVHPITRTFARLIRMPGTLADVRNAAVSLATADQAALLLQSAPNSIGTLSPRNPFVLAVNEIPVSSRVPHHTVVGDRGRGDTPESSDGVVPYWSAHLASADSEKVVPSGHGSHAHPEGIEEARRILRLHLKPR